MCVTGGPRHAVHLSTCCPARPQYALVTTPGSTPFPEPTGDARATAAHRADSTGPASATPLGCRTWSPTTTPRGDRSRGSVQIAPTPGGPMFRKVLVANRGEIAVRAFRAATEMGARTVAVFPYEDRKSEHRLKADEAYQIGEEGHPVRAYLDHEAIVAQAVEAGADAIYPGLRLPLGEPAARRGVRRRRHHLRRAAGLGAAPDRQQGPGDRRRPRRRPADPARLGARHRPRRPRGGGRRHRLPRLRQGGLGRRRTRYAPGGVTRDAARLARGGAARGRVGLRRPDALSRGGRGQPAAHRGAGPGRQHRRGRPPLRA